MAEGLGREIEEEWCEIATVPALCCCRAAYELAPLPVYLQRTSASHLTSKVIKLPSSESVMLSLPQSLLWWSSLVNLPPIYHCPTTYVQRMHPMAMFSSPLREIDASTVACG